MTLSSLKKVLAKVKRGCPAWLSLLHPHSLLDTKGLLAALGGGDSTKIQGTNPSCWEIVCSEFSDILENPGTLPERSIKHEIDLLPDSIPDAKK